MLFQPKKQHQKWQHKDD